MQTALPSVNIFNELQTVHEKGYFYVLPSLEEDWQQVCKVNVNERFSKIYIDIILAMTYIYIYSKVALLHIT